MGEGEARAGAGECTVETQGPALRAARPAADSGAADADGVGAEAAGADADAKRTPRDPRNPNAKRAGCGARRIGVAR